MVLPLRAVLSVALGGLPVAARTGELSPVERAILRYVEAHRDEPAALLEKWVAIDSATENLPGVRRMGEALAPEFQALGFETRWVDLPPETKRAGHLFAERRGDKGRRLLLIGHLDTVLPASPPRREGGRLYGSGAEDMKGGNAVLLCALRALAAAGALEGTRIIVAFSGDEERPGEPLALSRKDLLEAGRRSDAALAFEGAVGNTATIARRGSSGWRLEVGGRTGHSGGIFTEGMGAGAIFETARILNAFREELASERYLTFNVGVLAGGTTATLSGSAATAFGKANVVPPVALANGDLRTLSRDQLESVRARMRAIVARNLPRTHAEITFSDGYPAMAPTAGNQALLRELDRVSQDLGYGKVEALDPGLRGAGDVAFVSSDLPCLDGLGAAGAHGHAPGEYADLEALPRLVQRAAILIHRLTREEMAK